MANDRDAVLLETVKTHRARLLAAFLFGDLDERRVVNDNTKRLIGSIVLAAVICAGCVGFAFVSNILAEQAAEKEASSQVSTSTATPTPTPARDSEDGN
jgi:hypothetical protein